ncbi:hypothetical protein L208DRAFT_1395372 [Tricholoma matsutake]|nr:hypothetical protein L208DRAFT_1395372 [Tricholoma matsutake 945]
MRTRTRISQSKLDQNEDLQNTNKRPIASKRIVCCISTWFGHNGSMEDMSAPLYRLPLHSLEVQSHIWNADVYPTNRRCRSFISSELHSAYKGKKTQWKVSIDENPPITNGIPLCPNDLPRALARIEQQPSRRLGV